MPTGMLGYHPDRICDLQQRARRAAEHLLRSPAIDDPLAAAAMSTTRLVRAHLEEDWLPTLGRIEASTAMLSFSAVGPAGVAGWSWASIESVLDGGIPPEFGMSNADALAAANAAMAAGEDGRFVGRTRTYEVLETPPSTSIPSTGHDPDGGSGHHDVIVTDRWYFEHDLVDAPPPAGAAPAPLVLWLIRISELFRDANDRSTSVARERGLELEARTEEARGPGGSGGVSATKNVAVGLLTTGDTAVEFPAVSGKTNRPGYVPIPETRRFKPQERNEFDTEVKILEVVADQLTPADDGLVEIYTERPPCESCQRVMADFHRMFPNVQVRIYFRSPEVAVN